MTLLEVRTAPGAYPGWFWPAVGAAMLACVIMSSWRDWEGDEEAAYRWAYAFIAVAIAAGIAWACEYMPVPKAMEGRPFDPTREHVTVYDPQPIEWRD